MTNKDASDSEETLRRKRLFALVHADIKRQARRFLSEHATSSLSTDGLVSEAYIKLMQSAAEGGSNNAHFFRVAAKAMRQIIVDHARAKLAQKRAGEVTHLNENIVDKAETNYSAEVLTIEAALAHLYIKNARIAQIVELHFFAGLKFKEISEHLGISIKTIERDWRIARSELYAFLEEAQRDEL